MSARLKSSERVIAIPFYGFYGTIHEDHLDRQVDLEIEELSDEEAEKFQDSINWPKTKESYARAYVGYFEGVLKEFEIADFGYLKEGTLEFDRLSSPREYNFETDKIFCKMNDCLVMNALIVASRPEIKNSAGKSFEEFLFEGMAERSGFIPFYSNKIEDWFGVDLTVAQVGYVFEWLFEDYEFDWDEPCLFEVQLELN